MTMKRTISIVLVFIMAFAFMAAPVFADEPAAIEDIDEIVTVRIDIQDVVIEEGEETVIVRVEPTPVRRPAWDDYDDSQLYQFQLRYRRGIMYMPIREVAEHYSATVEWDGASQTVYVTMANGDIIPVVLTEVGGYNDNGTVWVPVNVLTRLFRDFDFDLFMMSFALRPIFDFHVDPVDPRDPIVRTTNHGQMAIAFIEYMSNNLYSRYPFSYRELEAAEWIIYQLTAMGHYEGAIEMQTFSLRDVTTGMGRVWEILDMELAPYETYALLLEYYLELLIESIGDFMEEWGLTYEEIEDMASMNATRMMEIQTYGIRMFGIGERSYSQNVLLTIPGQSERKIIVTAHYDTIENVPGASDNASGVGLLLEAAYRMLGVDNYYTIVFAFVGAEEVGLLGAAYYLESLTLTQRDNIMLNINADVLFEGPYFFFGAAALGSNNILVDNDITRRIEEIAYELNSTYGTDLISAQDIASMPSDQLIFLHGGHTVVALTGLAIQGAVDYEGYPFMTLLWHNGTAFGGTIVHTAMDCVHYINAVWPYKIGDAMWTFSLFLEALLTAYFE